MPEAAQLTVVTHGYGWAVHCSVHGQLLVCWGHHTLAAFDLLGHAAHFHTVPVP